MLNFRLLYTLLDWRSIRSFLGIMASLGFGVLLDILLLLKLADLAGPWIIMTALASLTALGFFITYRIVEDRRNVLVESVDLGEYDEELFTAYVSALTSGLFLITPGVVNKILGGVLLIPPLSAPLGDRLALSMGIDWTEAYEYLRLNRVASPGRHHSAEG